MYPFKPAPPMYTFTTSVVALAMASGWYTQYIYTCIFHNIIFVFSLTDFFLWSQHRKSGERWDRCMCVWYHSWGYLNTEHSCWCSNQDLAGTCVIFNILQRYVSHYNWTLMFVYRWFSSFLFNLSTKLYLLFRKTIIIQSVIIVYSTIKWTGCFVFQLILNPLFSLFWFHFN